MKRVQTNPKAKPSRKKPRFALIEKDYPGGKLMEFPGIKGRVLEKVELVTSHDYHCISLSFRGKKTLHLMIDPGFTLKAHLRDWTDGEGRSIKGWPPIASAGLQFP